MVRKVSPSLINLDSIIYAILCPGSGYMKKQYGEFYFYDKLPRASGCFMTREAAELELESARNMINTKMNEIIQSVENEELRGYYSAFYRKRMEERKAQADAARVVRVSID